MGILALVIAAVFAALFFASKKAAPPCRLLAPSALAICACALCLSATTYAWFTATSTSTVATIQAAEYNVSIDMNATGEWDGDTYSVTFDTAGIYPVTLTASGNAAKGYCEIDYNGTECYKIIPVGASFSFTVCVAEDDVLKITPKWGACEETSGFGDGSTIPFGIDLSLFTAEPETPEPTPEDQSEIPENPDDTYLVSDDTETPETDPEPPTE